MGSTAALSLLLEQTPLHPPVMQKSGLLPAHTQTNPHTVNNTKSTKKKANGQIMSHKTDE